MAAPPSAAAMIGPVPSPNEKALRLLPPPPRLPLRLVNSPSLLRDCLRLLLPVWFERLWVRVGMYFLLAWIRPLKRMGKGARSSCEALAGHASARRESEAVRGLRRRRGVVGFDRLRLGLERLGRGWRKLVHDVLDRGQRLG